MKYFKSFILYLFITVIHFLLQSALMFLSFFSKLVFYDEAFWSIRGIAAFLFSSLDRIFSFPIVWIFQKWSVTFSNFPDLPFILNSLLWGLLLYAIIVKGIINKRRNKYSFVKGIK